MVREKQEKLMLASPEAMVEPIDEPIEEVEPLNTVKPVDNSGTPLEIIRHDVDEGTSEQLNLF